MNQTTCIGKFSIGTKSYTIPMQTFESKGPLVCMEEHYCSVDVICFRLIFLGWHSKVSLPNTEDMCLVVATLLRSGMSVWSLLRSIVFSPLPTQRY
jgi:hypothetical protein